MRGLSKPGRQLIRACRSRPMRQHTLPSISAAQGCRYGSSVSNGPVASAADIDVEAIKAEMLARPPQIHHDTMYPANSQLLTTALSDFLPGEYRIWRQPTARKEAREDSSPAAAAAAAFFFLQGDRDDHPALPPGHHLVYFPLRLRGSELCPDGTDPYHAPRDARFTRRMWAGGSVRGLGGMALDGSPAVCLERVVDVGVRGPAGAEKIFVEVLREYVTRADYERRLDRESMTLRPRDDDDGRPTAPHGSWGGITERRTLVFMRDLSREENRTSLKQKHRIIKAPSQPDYSVTLTPTPTLLFHYSALTYNAHRIHLDRSYCRGVEGHRNLLVHGPLSLTMMLSILQSWLARPGHGHRLIDAIDYRHLAPLYVGRPMRVCLAPQQQNQQGRRATEDGGGEDGRSKWDVWVENEDGSLCVRGTVETVGPRVG